MCQMILLINKIKLHRTIKMRPIEVTDDYYAKYNRIPMELHSAELRSNKKNPKCKVADNVRV